MLQVPSLSLLFTLYAAVSSNQDFQWNTYKAAVVEFSTRIKSSSPTETITNNGKEYVRLIDEAAQKRVKIVVFPEYGLTGWSQLSEDNSLDPMSTTVPDPSAKIAPCDRVSLPGQFITLSKISCAAKNGQIYVVINVIEKNYDNDTSEWIYYNTNVVFDRNGVVIAKYRKINLYNEPLTSGDKSQVSTFQTDFGVKFGMFTCFDIAFEAPAQNILLDHSVTDIVFPTAWITSLPFYSSLSMFHGYSLSAGVNFLAAGLNYPEATNGGSAIFFADGRIGKAHISGTKKTKLLIDDIPIISSRDNVTFCRRSEVSHVAETHHDYYAGTDLFETEVLDLSPYTNKNLEVVEGDIQENLCSGRSNFCCTFDVRVSKFSSSSVGYAYKMIAFHGVQTIAPNLTLGVRHCGIVACLNESISTCGVKLAKLPDANVYFDKIIISTSALKSNHRVAPSTLRYDLKPLLGYKFCEEKINGALHVNITATEELSSILTFGLSARDYENDGKPAGINSANTIAPVYMVFLCVSFLFLEH